MLSISPSIVLKRYYCKLWILFLCGWLVWVENFTYWHPRGKSLRKFPKRFLIFRKYQVYYFGIFDNFGIFWYSWYPWYFLYVFNFGIFSRIYLNLLVPFTFFRACACACANYIPMNYTSKWRCPHIFVYNGLTVKYCLKTHIPYSIDYHPHPRGRYLSTTS